MEIISLIGLLFQRAWLICEGTDALEKG